MLLRPACRRHRRALSDFVDRREQGPGTAAALDHLDRCPGCQREMAALSLAIFAMRRIGREVATCRPPAELRAPRVSPRGGLHLPRLRLAAAGPVVGLAIVLLASRGITAQPVLPGATVVPAAAPAETGVATGGSTALAPVTEVLAGGTVDAMRIYEPAAPALTRDVVAGFIEGSTTHQPRAARLVPIARDRATLDTPGAAAITTVAGVGAAGTSPPRTRT